MMTMRYDMEQTGTKLDKPPENVGQLQRLTEVLDEHAARAMEVLASCKMALSSEAAPQESEHWSAELFLPDG